MNLIKFITLATVFDPYIGISLMQMNYRDVPDSDCQIQIDSNGEMEFVFDSVKLFAAYHNSDEPSGHLSTVTKALAKALEDFLLTNEELSEKNYAIFSAAAKYQKRCGNGGSNQDFKKKFVERFSQPTNFEFQSPVPISLDLLNNIETLSKSWTKEESFEFVENLLAYLLLEKFSDENFELLKKALMILPGPFASHLWVNCLSLKEYKQPLYQAQKDPVFVATIKNLYLY